MNNAEILKAMQKIAFDITHGDASKVELGCPKCGFSPVIFSFALNRPPAYGLYVHCENCGLLHHFHLASRPPNFREDLILPKYQEMENEAMRFAESLENPERKNNGEK